MVVGHSHIEIKNKIEDQFGRTFKVLRVSLTNSCNLACTYCVDPSQPINKNSSKAATLTNAEYLKMIGALHNALDLETVRLTGGEPLLYKQLIPLIAGIKQIGIQKIKMTSNGSLLENKAVELKAAGLTDINVSLDALDEEVAFKINKKPNLEKILRGIDSAIAAGLKVKINCVVMKGVNDNQIIKLIEYGKKRNIPIRFLELMQMGHLYHNFGEHFFSEKEILTTIAEHYNFTPLFRDKNATTKYWITDDSYQFGIISNESDPFCNDCNRLRLDSYGNIYGCLSDNNPVSLNSIEDSEGLTQKLKKALSQKKTKFSGSELSMLHIGG
ncbi:MAG: Molybdenum cofactor biosynthesis protein MoaA [Bacteroidota bacterium]|nr:Molybdenum cofactor biosynthesis protein MoaA [Bacteroidota bacterium]